ncbi:hypothetical protein ACFLRX_03385 [Acidobacteriota bacterium]
MNTYTSKILATALVLFFALTSTSALMAQDETPDLEELKKFAPKVYLDCMMCDRDFFRDSITYVNFVRDRKGADIHVLVTQQGTGSRGQEYTFTFIGLEEFEGTEHSLVHSSNPTETRDDTRRAQVEVMERGIFPFIIGSPICQFINLDFKQKLEPMAVEDPWNSWVFSVNLDGRTNGQSSRSSSSLDTNISANRVTPNMKIQLGLSADFDRNTYKFDDEPDYIDNRSNSDFSALVVKSIGEHWSVGGWVEAESSTFSNMDFNFNVAPAVEFSFFPYAQSTRKQLRLLYRIGMSYSNYTEITIYEKMQETLYNETLMLIMDVRQPWGNISGSLTGSHYFHDFKKNRFELNGSISVRLIKGLSLTARGSYSAIRDQLNLPFGDYSIEEVLLTRKELQTDYRYSLSLGIRYTFGSVYSNVVNPRFGMPHFRGGGGGGGF